MIPPSGEQRVRSPVERRGLGDALGCGPLAEQDLAQPVGLRARDGCERQLCVGLAPGGRLDLDAHEPEEPVEERLGDDDAAHAVERDRPHVAPDHAGVELQPAAEHAIAEPPPGDDADPDGDESRRGRARRSPSFPRRSR